MTNRDIVSTVRMSNKIVSSDDIITDRAILAIVKSNASLLIKREVDKGKLWESPNLFEAFECIELVKVPLSDCCDYSGSCSVRKSKLKIPKIAEGVLGLLVQRVSNIENSQEFIFVTSSEYANILRMDIRGRRAYYWIYKDHLYVSNEHVEKVNMYAYPDSDVDPAKWNSCKSCEDGCPTNPLDLQFRCPSYLIQAVLAMTYETLMKTYHRLVQDKSHDLKDDEIAR